MGVHRLAVTIITVVLVCLMNGCSSRNPEAAGYEFTPLPPVAEYYPDAPDLETYQAGLQDLAQELGIVSPPETEISRWIDPDKRAHVMVSCLTSVGVTAEVTSSQSFDILAANALLAALPAFAVDMRSYHDEVTMESSKIDRASLRCHITRWIIVKGFGCSRQSASKRWDVEWNRWGRDEVVGLSDQHHDSAVADRQRTPKFPVGRSEFKQYSCSDAQFVNQHLVNAYPPCIAAAGFRRFLVVDLTADVVRDPFAQLDIPNEAVVLELNDLLERMPVLKAISGIQTSPCVACRGLTITARELTARILS